MQLFFIFKTVRLSHLLYQSHCPLGVFVSGYKSVNSITNNPKVFTYIPSFWVYFKKTIRDTQNINNLLLLLVIKSSSVLLFVLVISTLARGSDFFSSMSSEAFSIARIVVRSTSKSNQPRRIKSSERCHN